MTHTEILTELDLTHRLEVANGVRSDETLSGRAAALIRAQQKRIEEMEAQILNQERAADAHE